MALSTELRLNGLHIEQGTPELHHLFAVCRGDD
jgi:hypothetical protein